MNQYGSSFHVEKGPKNTLIVNGITFHEKATDRLKNKAATNFMDLNSSIFKDIMMIGITCTLSANEITKEKAWEDIDNLSNRCFAELVAKFNDISFILLTVEEHTGKKNQIKKSFDDLTEEGKSIYRNEITTFIGSSKAKSLEKSLLAKCLRLYSKPETKNIATELTEEGSKFFRDELAKLDRSLSNFTDRKNDLLKTCTELYTKEEEKEEKEEGKIEYTEKSDKTLLGYPHLHFAIGFENFNSQEQDMDPKKYGRVINTFFDDVVVGSDSTRASNKKDLKNIHCDNAIDLISYVLKNGRHASVFEKLKKYPVTFYPVKNNITFINFFKELSTKKSNTAICCMNFLAPAQSIEVTKNGTTINIEPKKIDSNISVKKCDTSLDKGMSNIITTMEKNELAIFSGQIYRKVKNSTKTWEFSSSIEDLVNPHYSWAYPDVRKNIVEIENGMKRSGQRIYPTIHLDYKWIEFKDCYLFLGDGAIYEKTTNGKYLCFAYFPDITYEQIKSKDSSLLPTKWLKILSNSNLADNKELLKHLYSHLLPKISKSKSLYLLGDTNSGKTTLVDSVIRILPLHKITTLSATKSGFKFSKLLDKYILYLDEAVGLFTLTYGEQKILLQSDSLLTIDRKCKDATDEMLDIHTIIISNEDVYPPDTQDETSILMSGNIKSSKSTDVAAIIERLSKYNFKTMKFAASREKQGVLDEKAKIVLYLRSHYFESLNFYKSTDDNIQALNNWEKEYPKLYKVIGGDLDLTGSYD